ncbi:MAG: ATP-dependent DNA helicase [Acidobacteria bacterium]|nr:ATP-dependent DNA helicase [Acidobacteriota bacterium]
MPQVPALSGSPGLSEAVRRVFSDGGALARVLDGCEARPGQRQMAEAVAQAIDEGGTLLAEAGTGTGKTLAYLTPAILSGRRVLVSTGTKNLQEQIYFKDLPLLQEVLATRFTATLMKGRGNYLCLHRWEVYKQSFEPFEPFEPFERERPERSERTERAERLVFLPIIDAWIGTTDTGDRAELRDLPEDVPIWKSIAAEAETCLGSECPHYDNCFVTRMRRRAAESDVVIVNHHLLCADAAVRQSAYGEVIPACSTLVVDEAHQLEDVATQYFGCSASAYRIEDLVRDAERLIKAAAVSPRQHEEIHRTLARAADHARRFFSGLALDPALQAARGTETRIRYTADALADHVEDGSAVAAALDDLEAALAPAARPPGANGEPGPGADSPGADDGADISDALAALTHRAGEIGRDLRFLLRAGDPDFVYYVETRGRGLFLRASPIDVSRIVQEALFDRMSTTVLTSATLAVDGAFEYIRGRLGIRQATELRVPSEFDYGTQALLYLPRRLPSPKAPAFAEAAAREVIELVRRSRGRAFVLFTSYGVLRVVQRFVEMALPYPILVQGTAPRTELIERFRSTPHAVLLATASFWQGVDVVGDALSCVIIDKLPFASPGDPVTAARIEGIRARGGDPFADYQVPLAILALQQGLGRLIRHRTDRGVLALLDPRIRTMAYGRRFLASLPPAPVTHDLDAVERFFE